MFDGFYVADQLDLRSRRGVVYVINFMNGRWYCGSTSQSFRLRYGTINLKKSALLTSSAVKENVAASDYVVWLHCMEFSDHRSRLEKEFLVIGDNHRSNAMCLNQTNVFESSHNRRKVELKSPTGAIVEFDSVKDAQVYIGATSHTQISCLLNGRFKSTLGWTLPGYYGKKSSELHEKSCTLIDPDGITRHFKSRQEAARAIGVRCVHELIDGFNTTIKGWTLPGRKKRKYLPLKVVSPSGVVHSFPSRLAASKAMGCCNQAVSMLCHGKITSVKGWVLAEPCENRVGR